MTSMDRTIYRHVKRSYTTKELIEAYTPTEEERHYVETTARSPQHRLNLMLWIKLFPCLGYFPGLDEIPPAIVAHVRSALSLPEELVPAYHTDLRHPRHIFAVSVGRCVGLSEHVKQAKKSRKEDRCPVAFLYLYENSTKWRWIYTFCMYSDPFLNAVPCPDNITHWPASRITIRRLCLESVCRL